MTGQTDMLNGLPDIHKLTPRDFTLGSLDDDLRVDRLCKGLLMRFYEQLLADGLDPVLATSHAGGADYFLRDFVIDRLLANPLGGEPGLVRRFAATWYIISTLEPDAAELGRVLDGVAEFYRFLHRNGLVSAAYLASVESECADRDYYAGRIDAFWAITGDGYLAWERECPLALTGTSVPGKDGAAHG